MDTSSIPVELTDLNAAWLSDALEADVTSVTVLDEHSGTTGRARLALTGEPGVPRSVFVKLAPFDAAQRRFVNEVGMGVSEARFFRDVAGEVGLRVPQPVFADFEQAAERGDDKYVMVLEDLESAGCRFPSPDDADIEFRARNIVEELAQFHARYWSSPRFAPGGDLAWLAPRGTASGDGGAMFVQMAVDGYADRLPDGFRALADLYLARSVDVVALVSRGPGHDGPRRRSHGKPVRRRRTHAGSWTGRWSVTHRACATSRTFSRTRSRSTCGAPTSGR